jgi:hypothetical protein
MAFTTCTETGGDAALAGDLELHAIAIMSAVVTTRHFNAFNCSLILCVSTTVRHRRRNMTGTLSTDLCRPGLGTHRTPRQLKALAVLVPIGDGSTDHSLQRHTNNLQDVFEQKDQICERLHICILSAGWGRTCSRFRCVVCGKNCPLL